ncbi:hypothetical protein [Propionivibrio limicola]|uniref:hypothetical protein n=1 Tax=Propionivibrio limicola TaxID=167645 RepID=UPI001B86F72D|nr:hypothetical protein [Propionivibrio limicola]
MAILVDHADGAFMKIGHAAGEGFFVGEGANGVQGKAGGGHVGRLLRAMDGLSFLSQVVALSLSCS